MPVLPKGSKFSKANLRLAMGFSLALSSVLSLLSPLPALSDPYQVEGISEEELLKNIDLHHKPDSSSHLFLWWIDHDGKKVKRLNFEAVDVLQGGVAAAVKGPLYSSVLIDISGDRIGKEEYVALGTYSEGLIPAETQFNWGFIDRSGEYVIRPQFNSVDDFSEGLAPACKDKLFGFIDRLGNFAIQPKFQKAASFHENLAAAKLRDKWGYIDKDGTFIIQPQFDQAGKFSDERAVVQVGTKWGVIDQNGKFCAEPKYLDAGYFREGVCPVKDGEKWGFIDRQGAMVIPATLDRAFPFHEGNAAVRSGNKFGYIDHDSKFEIAPSFDLALPYAEGVAVVGEVNWNHPSTRMFLMSRHLETMKWRKDDSAKSLTGFYIPQNQDDAVKELLATLPKAAIADMEIIDQEEMSSYQYALGLQMRNNWGLWKGSRLCKYYGAKKIKQPEEMTGLILDALWHSLHDHKH
ncbi:MAG: WG repeat-containing protein [Cyanobacteria bacterium REEB67]|nr:WG repeat-containing protein [Cyanobacteria bacterium REEB67]